MGGTGLGLAIVKHISVLLNAEISVESKIGEGTTFTIRIPTAKQTIS
jgi:two-component system phosphate regulon sensor histidine kinase PhoR